MSPKQTTYLNLDLDNSMFLKLVEWPRRAAEVPYRVVPEAAGDADTPDAGEPVCHWRITLTPVGFSSQSLLLEVRGDAVIGAHRDPQQGIEVNVDHWHGRDRGVSRRHLMLRPSRHKLFIIDLKSTNGTRVNGLPLGVGWAYALRDNDLITLGRLHIRVRVTQAPTTAG